MEATSGEVGLAGITNTVPGGSWDNPPRADPRRNGIPVPESDFDHELL
jgi:hypothetical protein